jgi:polyhydroxybutyrate depolymerase
MLDPVVPRRRSPMALWVAAIAMMVLIAGGCGSSGDGGSTTADSPVALARDTAETTNAEGTDAVATDAATSDAAASEAAPTGARVESEAIGDRRFEINVPAGYNGSKPVALVVVLHGYTGSGAGAKEYFKLEAEARKRGFLTVYPDGIADSSGNQFWNATDACCQLTATESDDSAFLTKLIDRVEEKFAVDPKRVYVAGHSNGGFMSYRMACEHADRIAAIVSVAGATFDDVSGCRPSQAVSVLQVHGTSDAVISFTGGSILGDLYPGALTSVTTWAAYDGCSSEAQAGAGAASFDLDELVAGNDAGVTAFAGCPPGVAVELWAINGGSHEPALTAEFASSIMDFLLAHPKP